MRKPEDRRPVTLEDLLSLKRTERPAADFWNRFERELRAKQLAALVEKRPWWRGLPELFSGFARYHLPLGATAVLALTIVSVRHYRPAVPNLAAESSVAVSTSAATSVAQSAWNNAPGVRAVGLPIAVATPLENEPVADVPSQVVATNPAVPADWAQFVPMNGARSDFGPILGEPTPGERPVTTMLTFAKSAEPAAVQPSLGAARGFETRALPARVPASEPLAQMASPADARRSRLLGGSVMSVSMILKLRRFTLIRSSK